MKSIKKLFLSLVLCTFAHLASDPITVKLRPPSLKASTATSCDRPKRSEGVNISSEFKNQKLVVHCYGHGGFGFTTLFGSRDHAIALITKENVSLQTPIHIIGSGCMGLAIAAQLHYLGYKNITISTKEKYHIPSWRAGGFFDPGVGNEEDLQEQFHVQLGVETYFVLQEIEQGKHPYLTSAIVTQMPIYYPVDYNVGVEILEKLGLMPPSQRVTIDFGNGAMHEGYKKQDTYFINVTELMTQLWNYITINNIPVINQEIKSFEQCTEPIVCNCTGLGSYDLNNDNTLYPVRGHLFMLQADDTQKPLDYMLFTKVMQNDRKEMIYFFPKPAFKTSHDEAQKCSGMLGGTFIPCSDLDQTQRSILDYVEFEKLKERSQEFFYGN